MSAAIFNDFTPSLVSVLVGISKGLALTRYRPPPPLASTDLSTLHLHRDTIGDGRSFTVPHLYCERPCRAVMVGARPSGHHSMIGRVVHAIGGMGVQSTVLSAVGSLSRRPLLKGRYAGRGGVCGDVQSTSGRPSALRLEIGVTRIPHSWPGVESGPSMAQHIITHQPRLTVRRSLTATTATTAPDILIDPWTGRPGTNH